MKFNNQKIINYEIEVDYFCAFDDYSAYFVYAELEDGTLLDENQLEDLSDEYPEVIDQYVWDYATGIADFLYD